ncbi:MAG: hypothetical protein K6T81_08795 [Alicyclobacillus macrosporangiidus]|uniref:hypothetical protein n=1 Tax=Alicyclobacillus macrosporangiidus TaxID=392015 RepID=UPI0026EC3334|nr:hypothetical protein [Alicyclobacillus macrosporangiidus]MCL6598826.1 hypothetical protein [Alicyclobacillus macrosporangiidus]
MVDGPRLSVYPDGSVSWDNGGTRYNYRRSDTRILIFVDEKGALHPTVVDNKDLYPEMFVSLAVVIEEDSMPKFTDRFHAFKRKVRPDLEPCSWEIKGRGYQKSNGEHTTREDMIRTWRLFSDWLRRLDIEWHLHACVSNREKIVQTHSEIDWNHKSASHSLMRTNLAALVWNCIALRGMRMTSIGPNHDIISPIMTVHDIHMFYDRLRDKHLERELPNVFRFCFEQDPLVRGLIDTLGINAEFVQIGFDDRRPCFAGIEFADMVLYVVYNFIAGRDVAGMSSDPEMSLRYYQPMLHAIRKRIARSVFLGRQEVSSVIRMSDCVDYTFGRVLVDRMSTGIPQRIQI